MGTGLPRFPASLPGGFTGVDVFFVISGFLISSIILAEQRRNAYSIGSLYIRRMRRSFPVLLVILAACLAIGWAMLLPCEFRQLGKHVAGGAGLSPTCCYGPRAAISTRPRS